MSAELNPKTSHGGQWDPTHQDALPTGTQAHLCTTLARSKALCHTSGDRDQQARPLPAQSTATTETLLLCQTKDGCPAAAWGHQGKALSRQLWVCSCHFTMWHGGVAPGDRGWQSSTAPPPSAQNGSGTLDRHACQVFPIKINNTRSLPGKDRSMEGILFV